MKKISPSKSRWHSAFLLFFAATFVVVRIVLSAGTQTGPNFVVNSLADADDGSCDALGQGTGNKDCTLREAINAANSYGDAAVISFNFDGVITLNSILPNITSGYSIDGSGQVVTVSGNGSVGIFQITKALQSGGSPDKPVTFNALTISNSSNNKGAIWVLGSNAVITNCLLASNSSPSNGGALDVDVDSKVTVANCTFFDNNAGSSGGAINVLGYPPNNFPSALYVYNSTFYNNHAHTVTGGSGAQADIVAKDATAELRNTILLTLDNNTNAFGLTYADTSDIYNSDISSQNANAVKATESQINVDSTLSYNGGSTRTLALLPGSVAINAGNNSAATGAPVNNQDQRGYVRVRPGDPTCDVGAYESGSAGSLVVTTTSDLTSATGGQNSLRTAVTYANSLGGSQTITFAAPLAGQTVTLSTPWSNADSYRSSSALSVENGQDITIQGLSSAPGVTLNIANGPQLRHFLLNANASLTLANLTLTGGNATVANFGYGGAVWNFGNLIVRNCTFTGNNAGAEGGAIQSWGESQSLLIENSTFTGNFSNGNGDAIDSGAVSMTFHYVTIANNSAANGNALAIYKYPLTMVDSLIAGSGGEGVVSVNGGSFSGTSTNNILTTATAPGLTNGTNSNQLGVPIANIRLGALANNGGPTATIALQPGSVAVDKGVAIAGVTTDQRGTTRPQGSLPDVGAFELIATLVPGIYTGVDGQSGYVGTASLVGYPGAATPGFPLLSNLSYPGGMIFDAAGNLYFTSFEYTSVYLRVYKLAQGSNSPQIIASIFNQYAAGMAINANGDTLYVLTNPASGTTTRIFTVSLTGGGPNLIYSSSAFACAGAAMDPGGNLFFADISDQQILELPNGGNLTVFATGVAARGLAFDASGNLVVSTNGSTGNDSILKFAPGGARSTFAAGLANVPLGIAFDTNGNLFVAETGAPNQAGDIIKIDPNGTKTVFDSNLGPANAGGNGGPQYLAIYPRPGPAAIPIVSPLGGTYESSVQVTITSLSLGTTVRYTLDGTTPSSTYGQIYSGPFTLTQNTTVKAIAYGGGWMDSPIASVDYTVLPPLPYWRNLQGLAADGSQDLANPSGDGVSNLAKYAFNLAPNAGDLTKANYQILAPNGTAGLPLITRDGQDHLIIEFVRRKASTDPGISYTVETGPDLANWFVVPLTNASVISIDSTWERVIVTDPTSGPTRFGRVRIQEL